MKIAAKARSRNLHTKRQVREAMKAFTVALEAKKTAEAQKTHQSLMGAIDIAAKKNVIHKNKAARFKSRLAKQLIEAGIKPGKVTVKKPAAKKTVTKKPVGTKKVSKAGGK